MRKGMIHTERDFSIMFYLGFGLTTANYIFDYFFAADGKNKKTRLRVMQRRLQKLLNEGLIQARYSPRTKSIIYTLTESGAIYVADGTGAELTNLWTHFPKDQDMYHDLIVSGVAKKLVRDNEQAADYTLEALRFERFLKIYYKGKKGVYYPDIEIWIKTRGGTFKYNIEIDCGTISRRDFFGKINSFEGDILFITNTEERLDRLLAYLGTIRPGKKVLLTTKDEFGRNGLLGCKWFSPKYPEEGRNLLTDEQIWGKESPEGD